MSLPPLASPRPRVALATVALLVPDCDAAIAFFEAGLGFAVLQDEPPSADGARARFVVVGPPPPLGGAALADAGGGSLGAAVAPAAVGFLLREPSDAAQAAAVGHQAGGAVAFVLHTDDFARDHAGLLAAGGTFLEEPRVEAYGKVAVWADPWGNKWDLLPPPA